MTKSHLFGWSLFAAILVWLPGCSSNPPKPKCGDGKPQFLSVVLDSSVGEQGAGLLFYTAFDSTIQPTPCDRKLTGLEVDDSVRLSGFQVHLIAFHKIQSEMKLADIAKDPSLYLTVNPGESLSDEQLKELFGEDLTFPIEHQITAFLTPPGDYPEKFYVTLEWPG